MEETKHLISKFVPSISITETHTSGLSAIINIIPDKPALLWVDMGLPVQNGKAFIEEVYTKTGKMPFVIFMSAENHIITDVYNCNAFIIDFLLKPFSPDRLKKTENRIKLLLNTTL